MNKKKFIVEMSVIMGGIVIIILTEAIGPSASIFFRLEKITETFILKTIGSSFIAGIVRILISSLVSFLGYFFAGIFVGYLSSLRKFVLTIFVSILPLIYTAIYTVFSRYTINATLTYYLVNILLIAISFFICLLGVIIGRKLKHRKIIQNT
jgi:hypothetical protein